MMFEEKRLSSSTLFKTVIFAGVLCLLIIYRGNSVETPVAEQMAQKTQETSNSNIRQIELTAEAAEKSKDLENTQHATNNAPQTGDTIGDLITGSIESETLAPNSIGQIAEQETVQTTAREVANTSIENIEGADSAASLSNATVQVQSGDTLYSISRKTGVSVAVLSKANGIKQNIIRVGQVLRIPR